MSVSAREGERERGREGGWGRAREREGGSEIGREGGSARQIAILANFTTIIVHRRIDVKIHMRQTAILANCTTITVLRRIDM